MCTNYEKCRVVAVEFLMFCHSSLAWLLSGLVRKAGEDEHSCVRSAQCTVQCCQYPSSTNPCITKWNLQQYRQETSQSSADYFLVDIWREWASSVYSRVRTVFHFVPSNKGFSAALGLDWRTGREETALTITVVWCFPDVLFRFFWSGIYPRVFAYSPWEFVTSQHRHVLWQACC